MLTIVASALVLHIDLTPTEAARVELEVLQSQRTVAAKYGHKKPSELTSDETKEKIRDRAEAENAVLEKHGLNAKEWARIQALKTKEARAEQHAALRALIEQHERAQQQRDASTEAPTIQVQRGFNDENPVVVDEVKTGAPSVETGLPPDVVVDQAAAKESDKLLKRSSDAR